MAYFVENRIAEAVAARTLKLALVLLLAWSAVPSFAQGRSYGLALGTGHYIGDLGGSSALAPWKATDMRASRLAFSGFVEFPTEGRWQVHTGLSLIQLHGDDRFADSPSRIARNLHFKNTVLEAHARGQFKFWDRPRHWNRSAGSRGYVFLGVGMFTSNPKARVRNDSNDIVNPIWYKLRELTTEGQDKPYSLVAFSMPMGFGFDWNLTGGWQVGLEVNWRYTSTDYLDDVSGSYADPNDLSELAAVLSSQANAYSVAVAGPSGGSVLNHQYSAAGTQRGNPLSRDGFGTVQLTLARPDASLRSRPGSWVGRFRRMGWLR
jgi:hypothetical protein